MQMPDMGRSATFRGGSPQRDSEPQALQYALQIYAAATGVLKVHRVGGRRWKRNVATGARIGPWLQAQFDVLDESAWFEKGACLYMVGGGDGFIRYVGISRNGLKHRWRTSPAYDAETMARLPERQLFHSQCWKHIEAECTGDPDAWFEVRSISGRRLSELLERLGPPLSALAMLQEDGESIVAAVERWLCNRRSDRLARWNAAMVPR